MQYSKCMKRALILHSDAQKQQIIQLHSHCIKNSAHGSRIPDVEDAPMFECIGNYDVAHRLSPIECA